ncbi:hypothetical protein ACFFMN_23310 [Planobispora siamensis]|uniref:Uncharacterized protein n=1 Tax=Planobispora siamensis TaxID=936338 RepID=A0A8J3SIT3_9ACTN|nr:hypothetical protein [Planobispora siamensis]GIH95291.1 hypothetical protein Psi01_59210 [Planobispora siamensis]
MRRMPASPPLVFTDTETTGLTRPYLEGGRIIWEYAHIYRYPNGIEEREQMFLDLDDLPFDPLADDLDPEIRRALEVGHFYDRHPQLVGGDAPVVSAAQMANRISVWFAPDADIPAWDPARPVLVGCVPSFEDLGLADLLIRNRHITSEAPWHYRLVCAENLMAGRLRAPAGWRVHDLAARLGLDVGAYALHTAMGDATFARDAYDAVMGHTPARAAWLTIQHLIGRGRPRFARGGVVR